MSDKSDNKASSVTRREAIELGAATPLVLQTSIFDDWWPFDDETGSASSADGDNAALIIATSSDSIQSPAKLELGSNISGEIDESTDQPTVTLKATGKLQVEGTDLGTL